jgi:DNA polymerase-3 subunit delta
MTITYNQLEEKLEREDVASCYLFVGEEDFLKQKAVKRLSSLLSGRKIIINRENEKELDNILSQSQLFGRRLVLIEDASSFCPENKASLLEYIKNQESSTIILLEKERNPKLEKNVAQNGDVVTFPRLKGKGLILWAKGLFQREGREIDDQALDALLDIVGDDTALLAVEIEKLICFSKEKERVVEDDVTISSSRGSWQDSFKLFELIKRGDKNAINLCLQLIEDGMSESHILFFLASKMRKERAGAEVFKLLADTDLSLKSQPKVSYTPIILSLILKIMRKR